MTLLSVISLIKSISTKSEKFDTSHVNTNGFKDLFKRREGGTTFGNILRDGLSMATGRDFSNFNKLQSGETVSDTNLRDAVASFRDIKGDGNKPLFRRNVQSSSPGTSNSKGLFLSKEEKEAKKENKGIIKMLFPKDEKWYKMKGVWAIVGIGVIVWMKFFRKKKKGGSW